MSIKNIRNLTKEITKEEWKKRVIQVGAVSIGLLLTLGCIPASKVYDNYKEQKKEEEHSIKNISLLDCKVIVENFPNGTVKHHFVNNNRTRDYIAYGKNDKYSKWDYEYIGITNNNFVVSYSRISYNTTSNYGFIEVPETYGKYIFDYNVPYYVFDATDLSLPEGYSFEGIYSVNDLKGLEEKLDNSIYETKKEKNHRPRDLCLVEIDGKFMCFDCDTPFIKYAETTNKEDITKLRNVYYAPSIENNLMLKVSTGMSAIEESIKNISEYNIDDYGVAESITSLDKENEIDFSDNFEGKKETVHNIYDYLTEEQKNYHIITTEELLEILDKLNNKDMNRTRLKEE